MEVLERTSWSHWRGIDGILRGRNAWLSDNNAVLGKRETSRQSIITVVICQYGFVFSCGVQLLRELVTVMHGLMVDCVTLNFQVS